MKITFLLAFSPNPRMTKRLRALNPGNDLFLIYWKMHDDYLWGGSWNDIRSKEIWIRTKPGEPLKRIGKTFRFFILALRELRRERPECLYVQNLDMLLLASVYRAIWNRGARLIYEIADIHPILIQPPRSLLEKIIQTLLRRTEKKLCGRIHLLVNTSDKYYDDYYSDFIPREKLLVIPNAPEKDAFLTYRKKEAGPFTVGFIGAVQFKEELKLLIDAAGETGVLVRIAGSEVGSEIRDLCKRKGVYYHGSYNYDQEIARLYGEIDCVFAVYDAKDKNVRLALPNKLYEAIQCELPILVAKGTYLSELVENLGVGISLEHDSRDSFKSVLQDLKNNQELLGEIRKKCIEAKDKFQPERLNEELIRRVCGGNKGQH